MRRRAMVSTVYNAIKLAKMKQAIMLLIITTNCINYFYNKRGKQATMRCVMIANSCSERPNALKGTSRLRERVTDAL
jgi:hypothetical protein